jgi:hypothetical protein
MKSAIFLVSMLAGECRDSGIEAAPHTKLRLSPAGVLPRASSPCAPGCPPVDIITGRSAPRRRSSQAPRGLECRGTLPSNALRGGGGRGKSTSVEKKPSGGVLWQAGRPGPAGQGAGNDGGMGEERGRVDSWLATHRIELCVVVNSFRGNLLPTVAVRVRRRRPCGAGLRRARGGRPPRRRRAKGGLEEAEPAAAGNRRRMGGDRGGRSTAHSSRPRALPPRPATLGQKRLGAGGG